MNKIEDKTIYGTSVDEDLMKPEEDIVDAVVENVEGSCEVTIKSINKDITMNYIKGGITCVLIAAGIITAVAVTTDSIPDQTGYISLAAYSGLMIDLYILRYFENKNRQLKEEREEYSRGVKVLKKKGY